jgi:GNAT superfamily N-acetyltransferase
MPSLPGNFTITEAAAGPRGPATAVPSSSSLDYQVNVVLCNGSTVQIRAIRREDEQRLAAFFRGLSDSSRFHRFFAAIKDEFLDRAAAHFCRTDPAKTVCLVATVGSGQRIIGHAMYAVVAAGRAEVAFAVAEDWREQGLGTHLLAELARTASSKGIRLFTAFVLPDNYQMLNVFQESGFPIRTRTAPGEILIEFPTDSGKEALELFERGGCTHKGSHHAWAPPSSSFPRKNDA